MQHPKNRQKFVIWAPSHYFVGLYLRHVSTVGKKLANQQYLLQMSSQYGELGPLAAEIGPV